MDFQVNRRGNLVRVVGIRRSHRATFLRVVDGVLRFRFEHQEAVDRGRRMRSKAARFELYHVADDGVVFMTYPMWRCVAQSLRSFGFAFEDPIPPDDAFFAHPYDPDPGALERKIRSVGFRWRSGQAEAFREIASSEGGFVHIPGGFGKTSAFLWAVPVYYPNANVLIVTSGSDLVLATRAEVSAADYAKTGVPRSLIDGEVHQVGAGSHSFGFVDRGRRWVAVSTIHSAWKFINAMERGRGPHIVLCDECHSMFNDAAAETLMEFVLRGARVFGLSATEKWRRDGLDARMRAIFGPRIFYRSDRSVVRAGNVLQIHVHWAKVRGGFDLTEEEIAEMKLADLSRYRIWKNKRRNRLIGRICAALMPQQVLIIVEKVNHIENIVRYLPVEPEIAIGPTSMRRKRQIAADFRAGRVPVVVSNVWHQGMSFEALGHVIVGSAIARPDRVKQTAYRVNRVHEESGKEAGHLYDFWDEFAATTEARSKARADLYADSGFLGARDLTEAWMSELGVRPDGVRAG